MLSLFRNRKKVRPVAGSEAQDKVAKNVVVWCLTLQERWAAFMQTQTERLSGNGKLILLTLFCLIAGSVSIYHIANSLIGYPSISIKISRIKAPLYTTRSGEENTRSEIVVTRQEYERLVHFRQYMDSLARSPGSKPFYDSILKQRPGLMDSVAFVENIYQSQIK